MREAMLTNAATAGAITAVNPLAAATTSSQAASSVRAVENSRFDGVLSKDKGIQAPEKRTESIFEASATDPRKKGAAQAASEDNLRRLITVA